MGKREFALEHFPEIYHLVVMRILALEHLFLDTDSPSELCRKFCIDPVMTMIKNEVLKISKRPRIIGMTSIVTEIVMRLATDEVSHHEVAMWGSFYSCIGIGFTTEASDMLHDFFGDTPIAKSDVPSFDVSRTEEEAILDNDIHMYQLRIPIYHRFYRIYYNLTLCTCRSVFVFTDGVMWSQRYPGATKSGCKRTSKGNTESRARRSYAVARSMGKTDNKVRNAGDDAVESHYPNKMEAYHTLGFPLRDYEIVVGDIDFCSHYFPKGSRPIGQRIVKSVAALLFTKQTTSERIASFMCEYSNHPDFVNYFSKIFVARPKIKNL